MTLKSRKSIFTLAFGLLLISGAAAYFVSGDKGATAAFTYLNSKQQELNFKKEYSGKKIVIVHFWATWCAPCLTEFPALVEFSKRFQDVDILALSLDEGWPEVEDFLKDKTLSPHFKVGLDPLHKIAEHFGSFQYPETYILDHNLKIVAKLVGSQPWSQPEFLTYFEQLLGKMKN